MIANAPLPPPPGWGTDKLTSFFDDARGNQYATFVQRKLQFIKLRDLDECFMTIGENLTHPRHLIAPFLLMRCHSALRATASLVMAGQLAECYVMTRCALEHAAYGLHMTTDPMLPLIWLKRHDDDETDGAAMKASKEAFRFRDLVNSIAAKDNKLAPIFERHYQDSIDFGAHPNERSVTGSMTKTDQGDQTLYQQAYLQGDGLELDHALIHTIRTSLCCLFIFGHVFPERYSLLGVTERAQKLREGL